MTEQQRAFQSFLKQTENHTIEVLIDQGLHRHIKCSNNGSQIYRFDLVTWSGYLHVSGDMGDWTFARLPDMFQFFRPEKGFPNDPIAINPGYWSQKLKAHPKDSPPKQFNPQLAFESIKESFDQLMKGEQHDPLAAEHYWEELQDHFSHVEDEYEFYEACSFRSKIFPNHDWHSMLIDDGVKPYMEYSYHFCWVLYAIVWGIQRYDEQNG